MEYVPLDETLINSETCIRCGHCCKWTTSTQMANDNKRAWVATTIEDNDLVRMIEHNPVKVNGETKNPFELEIKCSKLIVDKEEDTYKCGVYLDRPKVCSDYNCFEMANKLKRRPQNFKSIKEIIKKVHNVDVEWGGELTTSPYKPRIENMIDVVEVK